MEKLNAMTEKLEQFFDRFFEKQYLAFRNLLDKAFEYTYRENKGTHDWQSWRMYLAEITPQLFK